MPSSRGSSQHRDWTQVSLIAGNSLLSEPPGKPKNTGVGSLFHLQGFFLTQELNWGLLALQADSLPAELPVKTRLGMAFPSLHTVVIISIMLGCASALFTPYYLAAWPLGSSFLNFSQQLYADSLSWTALKISLPVHPSCSCASYPSSSPQHRLRGPSAHLHCATWYPQARAII